MERNTGRIGRTILGIDGWGKKHVPVRRDRPRHVVEFQTRKVSGDYCDFVARLSLANDIYLLLERQFLHTSIRPSVIERQSSRTITRCHEWELLAAHYVGHRMSNANM